MTVFSGPLPTASAASPGVVFSRCVLSCHTRLTALSAHAAAAPIAFHAVCPTVAAHTRAVQITVIPAIGIPTLLVLDTAIAADETVVAVVSTVRRIARAFVRMKAPVRTVIPVGVMTAVRAIVRVCARLVARIGMKGAVIAVIPTTAIHSRAAVGAGIRVLYAAVAANQPVIAVVPAVRLVVRIGAGFVRVPAAVRAEVSIRVITAVGAIVRVFARLVVTVGVKGAVVAVPGMVLRSGRSTSPGVIAVVVVVVPGVVVDIGVVVVDDGRVTTATTAAPVHAPGMPTPAKAAANPTAASDEASNRDPSSEIKSK